MIIIFYICRGLGSNPVRGIFFLVDYAVRVRHALRAGLRHCAEAGGTQYIHLVITIA